MNLGAALRRSSIGRTRITGFASATAVLFVAAGVFGAGPATASRPYPPTPPCALSWTETSTHQPVLVGSGYDTDRSVAITLYPQARSLGSYATNSAGAFAATVDVARRAPSSWVTATSVNRSCSVVPPPTGGTPPTAPPTGGTSTGGTSTPPAGTPSTTPAGGPTTGGAGTSSAGNSSGGTTGGAGGGSGNSGGSGGSGGSAYPPSRGPGIPTSGSSGAPSAPGSTAPASTGSASSSPAPESLKNPSALGLPLTVIVVIAALLLLAGGLGVLFLTRRSG